MSSRVSGAPGSQIHYNPRSEPVIAGEAAARAIPSGFCANRIARRASQSLSDHESHQLDP